MSKAKWFNPLVLIVCCLSISAQSINPSVQQVVNSVDLSNLVTTVSELSGEKTFVFNGNVETIYSRYMNHTHNDLAAEYLKMSLENYGLTVMDQYYPSSGNLLTGEGRNIIAIKEGVEFPEQQYIICAHYDAISSDGGPATGADDNASGTAAVLEAARILSSYDTKYTLLFILFDEEELGLFGSKYYANLAWSNGDQIMGVINLDMIAFDSNNDWQCDVNYTDIGNSEFLKDRMLEINSAYQIGLLTEVHKSSSSGSDHASFWARNFGAILLIEDHKGTILRPMNNFNIYYHTSLDRLFAFNRNYYKAMATLAIATFADLAEIVVPAGIEEGQNLPYDLVLEQNYPNPFNPSTMISYSVSKPGFTNLSVYNSLGEEVANLVNEYLQPGKYSYQFDVSTKNNVLPSGLYIYRLTSGSNVETRKMILLK